MNVFVLSSGRCGSTSFIKACSHITNFSSAHESLINQCAEKRLAYPENHIEADNRLSWFLGRLDTKYANQAFYVHLTREQSACVASFSKRSDFGIMKAYKEGILLGAEDTLQSQQVAEDYLLTIDSNIKLFLKDKTHKMNFSLEHAQQDFNSFWQKIGAEGDQKSALDEWCIAHNAS